MASADPNAKFLELRKPFARALHLLLLLCSRLFWDTQGVFLVALLHHVATFFDLETAHSLLSPLQILHVIKLHSIVTKKTCVFDAVLFRFPVAFSMTSPSCSAFLVQSCSQFRQSICLLIACVLHILLSFICLRLSLVTSASQRAVFPTQLLLNFSERLRNYLPP